MNPRIRRLQADYASLQDLAARSDLITIDEVEGNPPERYVITINCVSIDRVDKRGNPNYTYSHRLQIQLHDTYPSRKPFLMMLSKVYHPNISARGTVCIGNEGDQGYAPSMKLADLVLRIVKMLRFENVGLESPFNLDAKKWAQKNMHRFPLDSAQIVTESELDIVILGEGDADPDEAAQPSAPNPADPATMTVDDLVDEISIL